MAFSMAVLATAGGALLLWLSCARPRLGLYTILAFAPTQFIFIPVSTFFVSPADILVLAAAGGLALRAASGNPRARHAIRLHVFLGVMVVGYVLGFIVLDHFSRTLVRVPLAIVPSILACELLRERTHFLRALGAIVAAGFIDALYGLWFIAAGDPIHPTRFSGMMGVNFSAIIILSAAAVGFARFARTRVPLKLLVPGTLALFGLATLSKMGVIALVVAWGLVVSRVSTTTNRRLVVTAALLLLGVALTQDVVRERVLARTRPEVQLDGVYRTSTDVRVMILRSAWRGLADQPLVGVGYQNFERYSLNDEEIRRSTAGTGYGTHNTFVEILVEGGLLAFVPLVLHGLLYARRLTHVWHAIAFRRDVVAAAVLSGLIVVLISAAVANVLLHYVFWAVSGVALAYFDKLALDAGALPGSARVRVGA